MIDLGVLKERGIDAESLKKLFQRRKQSTKFVFSNGDDAKRAALVDRIRDRVIGGRDFNIGHYSLYYALDLAYDCPFQQITPTLLSTLIDKSADDQTVLNSIKDWGLDPEQIFVEVPDPKTPGKNIRKVSVPAFFKIYVPLVQSYVKIRWAKIVNDRRLVPFLKYEPAVTNALSRMRCETITHRVETISRQYGYFDVHKQAIFRMLHYAECLQFPVEEWHIECQELGADSKIEGEPVKDKNGKVIGKKVVVKEGLRYHLPHPTRTYYDRAFLPSTFNSDTGCSFAGYWRVMRWGDVSRNKDFYNLESVGYAQSVDFYNKAKGYFDNVFRGCVINMPSLNSAGQGVSKLDAEKLLASNWYSYNLDDQTVLLTEHFEKLIPSEYGLGDYDHPVWFRFVIAGDDTIIYAAPVPYCPVVYYGYDGAEGRTHCASMSLEVLPFQDQFSNLLTQYLLTVRQNLTNLTLVDTDVVDEKDIAAMSNWGERFWRAINFLRFSSKKMQKKMDRASGDNQVVFPQKFNFQDTNGLITGMKTILDVLERVLVMSSLEVGQAASHEQTAEEVKNIAGNTSTRVVFTSAAVDIARDAWKRQIYQALMAYGQDEFYAQIPMEEPIDAKKLESMGFSYANDDDPEKSFDSVSKKGFVKTDKTAIAYESFVSDRDGDDRVNNVEAAKAMIQFMLELMNNPLVGPKIGAAQAITAANLIAKMAGFPREFKFHPLSTPEQDQNNVMQQVSQALQQMHQQLEGEMKQALVPIMDDNKAQTGQITEIQQALAKMLGDAHMAQQQQAPAPNVMPMPPQLGMNQFPPSVPQPPPVQPQPMY